MGNIEENIAIQVKRTSISSKSAEKTLYNWIITEKNYNPIIIHGISDEIWLENLDSDYKVIRIISKHIHNNEQLGFDKFKLNQIIKRSI